MGSTHQGAGNADALLHAARQLVGKMVAELAEPDEIDEVVRLFATFGDGDAINLQRKLDIGLDGAPRQQAEILKYHAGVFARLGERCARHDDFSLVGSRKTRSHP